MKYIYDIKPTITEASHDYKRNGEAIEADRIIDLRDNKEYKVSHRLTDLRGCTTIGDFINNNE